MLESPFRTTVRRLRVKIFAQFSSYYIILTERTSHTSRINLTNNVIGACTSGYQVPRCRIQPANRSGMCVSPCYRLLAETMRGSSRECTSICTYLLVCTSSLPISRVHACASVHKHIRQSFRYPCLHMQIIRIICNDPIFFIFPFFACRCKSYRRND